MICITSINGLGCNIPKFNSRRLQLWINLSSIRWESQITIVKLAAQFLVGVNVGGSVTEVTPTLAAIPFRVASIGGSVGGMAALSPCPDERG